MSLTTDLVMSKQRVFDQGLSEICSFDAEAANGWPVVAALKTASVKSFFKREVDIKI